MNGLDIFGNPSFTLTTGDTRDLFPGWAPAAAMPATPEPKRDPAKWDWKPTEAFAVGGSSEPDNGFLMKSPDYCLYDDSFGGYVIRLVSGESIRIIGDAARYLRQRLLIADGKPACSRRTFDAACGEVTFRASGLGIATAEFEKAVAATSAAAPAPAPAPAPVKPMKFAEFKRRLTVGLVLHCEHFERPEISGPRTITKLQNNAIRYDFKKPDGSNYEGWCHWPKAAYVQMGERSATFLDETSCKPVFTYQLPGN